MIGTDLLSLAALFGASFGAATILPFQSEIVFVAIQLRGGIPIWLLVIVAGIGNTLGSFLNYWMGRGIETWQDNRWFPVKPAQLERAQRWFARHGWWTLLLSWAPLGDAITVVAGIMHMPARRFLLIVGAVKTVRYIVLALLTALATG